MGKELSLSINGKDMATLLGLLDEAEKSAKMKDAWEDENVNNLLANDFDENYVGYDGVLHLGTPADIESVWTDRDGIVWVHVDTCKYEADVKLISMELKNILIVIKTIRKAVKDGLLFTKND